MLNCPLVTKQQHISETKLRTAATKITKKTPNPHTFKVFILAAVAARLTSQQQQVRRPKKIQ